MTNPRENVFPLPSEAEIETQAATWITVLGREHVGAEDMAAFKKWLSSSDRHRAAFDDLSNFFGELQIIKRLDDVAASVSELPPIRKSLVNRRVLMAMAASVALAFFVGVALYVSQYNSLERGEVYATRVGEQHNLELSDGSKVLLNTDSRIEVTFSRGDRIVRLERGEAHFAVEKDRNRPFLVFAAGGVVRAVGTAFAVRLRSEDTVEVTVEEGRVALTSLLSDNASAIVTDDLDKFSAIAQLSAGQNAVFSKDIEALEHKSTAEINRKLAWRDGMLAYSGETLSDVVADISRYTDTVIEIADPELRNMRVAGYYQIGAFDKVLESLELNLAIEIRRVDENHVRLYRSP